MGKILNKFDNVDELQKAYKVLEKDYTKKCQELSRLGKSNMIELPCEIGSYIYKAIKDKRVKKPHKLLVVGFWLSMNEPDNRIHTAYYDDKGKFKYSSSYPLKWIGESLFLSEKDAQRSMDKWRKENEKDN